MIFAAISCYIWQLRECFGVPDVCLYSGKLQWASFTIFWYFIDITSHQSIKKIIISCRFKRKQTFLLKNIFINKIKNIAYLTETILQLTSFWPLPRIYRMFKSYTRFYYHATTATLSHFRLICRLCFGMKCQNALEVNQSHLWDFISKTEHEEREVVHSVSHPCLW